MKIKFKRNKEEPEMKDKKKDEKNKIDNDQSKEMKKGVDITDSEVSKNKQNSEIEIEKYKTLLESANNRIEAMKLELEKWKTKYENFAKSMEFRFQEKMEEVSASTKKSLNDEKKRIAKESETRVHFVLSRLFEAIADQVLNTSKNALFLPKTASDETKNYARGFKMLINNLEKILQANGLTIIYPKINSEFDPTAHHAVSKVIRKGKLKKEIIVEVLTPQYLLDGKTISYAKVKVEINK